MITKLSQAAVYLAFVLPVSVSASVASPTSLRSGDGGDGSDDVAVESGSGWWPFHKDDGVESGITFKRTDTSCPVSPNAERQLPLLLRLFMPSRLQTQAVPGQSSQATFDDGHCKSSDSFGDNDCHYKWGEDITVNYDGQIDQELNEDVFIEISAKVGVGNVMFGDRCRQTTCTYLHIVATRTQR